MCEPHNRVPSMPVDCHWSTEITLGGNETNFVFKYLLKYNVHLLREMFTVMH